MKINAKKPTKMFNHLILSIFLSLHLSACSTSTNESSTAVVEEAMKIEIPATTAPEKAAIDSPVQATRPNPVPEKVVEKPAVKKVKTEVKAPQKLVAEAPKRDQPVEAGPVNEQANQANTAEGLVAEKVLKTASEESTVEKEVSVVETPDVEPAPPAPAKPNHSNWNSLLRKYVNTKGNVNYAGFKKDQALLQAYLDDLSKNPPQSSWSRNEKMAFWFNAYNAYTIKLIVDNYPVKSITDLKGGKPWDVKWIKIGTKTYSLNNIENDLLRPTYKDARIHFAVNCAAESCPPLYNQAWTEENLAAVLDKQAKAFINNPAYNKIAANKVQVSKIFDWYKEDFGNLIEYLNKYSTTKINANAKVEFLEYDWTLNKQ